MALFKALRSCHFYTFLRYQNLPSLRNPQFSSSISQSSFPDFQKFGYNSSSFLVSISSFFQRKLSASPQLEDKDELPNDHEKIPEKPKRRKRYEKVVREKKKKKKSLDGMFKQSVDGSEPSERESEKVNGDSKSKEIGDLKKPKKDVEPKSLYSLFVNKPGYVKKSLDGMFKESVDDSEPSEQESEKVNGDSKSKEIGDLKKKPKKDVEPKSLYSVFVNNPGYVKKSALSKRNGFYRSGDSESLKENRPRPRVKELSPEMVLLVNRLYEEGYLNDANFLPQNSLDLSRFNNDFSQSFLRSAAERFGQDHQEIAKWLSGSELKKVALFGCPSLEEKTSFAAKRLRTFFKIQEDTVCRTCILKESCKFVNKRIWNPHNSNLDLADVMRILTSYALESAPQQLVVPDDIMASTSKLLKDVLNLSRQDQSPESNLSV